MAERQLVVAVEGTAAMGPFWPSILTDYLDKIIRCFCGNELTGQKLSGANAELSLIVFNAHGSYSACLVQRSGWTRDMDLFFQWLSSISFTGGGFSEAAIAEGLAEALLMLSIPNRNQTQQNMDGQKHCILVSASNPYALPTPVSMPHVQNLEQNDTEPQTEGSLYDAEMVAKSFVQCCVSLSIISPKQLPKLRAIFNAGKRNPRATDPVVDNVKNPQFLVLLPENFMEALAALSRSGTTGLASNQNLLKFESQFSGPPTTIPSVNGSMMNRQAISVGTIPTATVKVEPNTVTSVISGGSPFSHVSSIPHGTSQGVPSLQTSSPSTTSQEIIANGDGMQEFKPLVNGISQPLRPVGPAAANVSILNNLSQARQVMSSASLTGASSMGLPSMGGTPMAIHMSNMISSGMQSSAVPAAQTMLSSASNLAGNSNLGVSPPLGNLPAVVGMGQSVTNMAGQGSLATGAQIGQSGIGINQNILNGLGPAGTMIPTPGMSQPVQAGLSSLGVGNSSGVNMPLSQHAPGSQQSQSKYLRVWEGSLSGQRQGKPVFICKLEGYRNAGSSETLAADWPPTMQIVRLISQDHMNNKQYVGKADFLVFRASNPHGFLSQLQEKKLCAVIQLPSQTLLLSVSDKPSRLIGMLFPGDMVVFKPQISSQQQPQQQQHQQQQQQQPQQPQQQMMGTGMNNMQQPQQQMMGTGMNQAQQPQQQMMGTGINQAQQPQQQMMGTGMNQTQQQQQQQQMMSTGMNQAQQSQQQMMSAGMNQTQQAQQQMMGAGMNQTQGQQQMIGTGMNQSQQVQQQMIGTGMNQTFVQGQGRQQMMSPGQMSSQGPPNMPGGGFLN